MSVRPHVLASMAVSLDGFLDDAGPERRILSGPADLDRVDAERAGVDAILVGAGTVRADDPRLLVRSPERSATRRGRGLPPTPTKVTLTRTGDLDPGAAFFTAGDAERLVYAPPEVADGLKLDATVVASSLEPADVLADLARRGVVRLMVEGGAAVHRSFVAAGVIDELAQVHAPVLLGDGVRFVGAPARAHLVETRAVGPDVLTRYRLGPRDDRWLAEACALAERCPPSASAFSVGAVVVAADDTVLATGYSRRDHVLDHAEEAALRDVDPHDPRLPDATVYSSLEPCGQRASRPVSCARHILDAGVGRVVMAWREPPLFVGDPTGVEQLADAGVDVVELPAYEALARRPNGHR